MSKGVKMLQRAHALTEGWGSHPYNEHDSSNTCLEASLKAAWMLLLFPVSLISTALELQVHAVETILVYLI